MLLTSGNRVSPETVQESPEKTGLVGVVGDLLTGLFLAFQFSCIQFLPLQNIFKHSCRLSELLWAVVRFVKPDCDYGEIIGILHRSYCQVENMTAPVPAE